MADQRYLILLSLVVVTAQVSLAQDPTLAILPSSILKAVGEGVYVSCEARVDDDALVTEMSWISPNGVKITNNINDPVFTDEDGTAGKLDLIINKLREQDVGEYTCTATYAGNQRLEAKIMVESFMDIDFGDTPEHQTLLIGEEGKIRCTPMGKPAPQVDWYKNREPLNNDENHIIQQDGILISKVTEADEGTYRCRARVVDLGSIKHIEIQVEVNIPPVINVPPQNITGKEHEEATFECSATGKPAPAYSWVDPQNQPLVTGDNFHVNTETGVLHIMNLKPEQTGAYRCTAENSAGEDFKTAYLQVFTKPKVEQYENKTVPVGSDLEMECIVTGNPAPRVIFKKESETRNFTLDGIDMQDDRIRVEQRKDDQGREVGILQITDVSRSDDGLYTCTAESEGGVTQRWGHITVEFSPTFEEQGPREVWSWEKAPVNLTCLATSIPNATIQWYFLSEEVDTNDPNLERLSLGPLGVLRVNPLTSSYFGQYSCEATNTLGSNSIDIELKEAHVPGPIRSAKVTKKTATTITWDLVDPTDNGGLEIQSYIVEYRLNDESWENPMREQWVKGSTYTIDRLRPLATYVFRFAAHSRVGDGHWGGEKSEVMPGHAAPEEPQIYGATSDVVEIPYTNHYELQWKVPLDNGKEIDHFQIRYYEVQEKEGQWEVVGKESTAEIEYDGVSTYKIEGLSSDSYYKIELRAHNEIGYSTPAEAIIKTAHGHDDEASEQTDTPNVGIIVAVIILVILVLAVVVDVTCYFTRNAGITATIKGKRGSKDLKDKETMLEDGKNASDEKHEGNGQMKTQKDDLKPEQQNSDKKESSEPTETTPMIQGLALQGTANDLQPEQDRNEVPLAPMRPTQPSSSFERIYDEISEPSDTLPSKPVIVGFQRKSIREEDTYPLSITRHNMFSPTFGNSLNNSRSTPLNESYSDDSLYAKPTDVNMPKGNTSTQRPHYTRSQEILSDMLVGNSPATQREGNPVIHKAPTVQPITVSMEDITRDRSETPQYRFNHEPHRLVNPFQTFGSREMLHQGSQSPGYSRGSREAMKFGSREALNQAIPRLYHMSRSREALNQESPWPYHMSRSREALNQANPWPSHLQRSREVLNQASPQSNPISRSREALDQANPRPNHLSKNNVKQNDELRLQSLMSNSREMLNDPSRFPLSNYNSKRPEKAPSISSCSTHYQPTDAMLQQPLARTAFRIAPYDDPVNPGRPVPQDQEQGALRNPKLQPSNIGTKNTFTKGSPGQMPKMSDKWSIPAPPPRDPRLTADREQHKPFSDVTKAYPRDTLQHSGYSLSMDNLDGPLDNLQPSTSNIRSFHQQPLPTTKSLNNLLDDSSTSLRSYGKPTLI